MRSPSMENIKRECLTEMFDSDETLVTEPKESKHKKKHHKSQSDDSQNTPSEASQSLLKVNKKKYFPEISEESSSNLSEAPVKKKKKIDSDFLTQELFNQSSSEDFVDSTPKKRKKKKSKEPDINFSIDSDSTISPVKINKPGKELNSTRNHISEEHLTTKHKKKKVGGFDSSDLSQDDSTIDFGTQNVFKQPSSEEFLNSTSKKLQKEQLKINGGNVWDSRVSSKDKIKQENNLSLTLDDDLGEEIKGHDASNLTPNYNSINFGTQDIFLLPGSEEFVNSTPKKLKKKKKKLKINGSDMSDSRTSSINEIKQESQNDLFKYADSFENSFPYTSDNESELSKLHHSFDVSDDSKSFVELEESEINIPCSKHKKKKHKAVASTNTFLTNGLSENDSKSDTFFCQFCISTVNDIRKDDSETLNNEDNRNDRNGLKSFDEHGNKISKKKRKSSVNKALTNNEKKNSLLDLLDTYLDNESWLNDVQSAKNASSSFDNTRSDLPCDTEITTNDRNNSDIDSENIDGGKKKKRKSNKLLSESIGDGQNTILDRSLTTHSSSEVFDNNYSQDILGVNGYGSSKNDEGSILSQTKISKKNKIKQKNHSRINAEESSLDIGDDSELSSDVNKTSAERTSNLKSMNGDISKNSSGLSKSDDSDDSDEGIEEISKIEELQYALKGLTIEIDFPIPKLHQICNRASKPTIQQRAKVAQQNIVIKNGKFVKAEDTKIKENWNKFIQMYNFEDIPEVFFSLARRYISVTQKQNFLFFLAQGLDERTPYSVYQRFKLLMTQLRRGRFTEEEDKYILTQMEENRGHRNYITDIAQHLQRPFHSIEKRIRRLNDRHTRKIRWKKETNVAAFIKYLLKATGIDSENIKRLKDRHISSFQWTRLSKKLDNVPIRILKRAWLEKIHPMLFIPGKSCDLREVRLQLVNMLSENNEYDWRAIDWNSYAAHFEGLTPLKVYSIMKTLVQHKVSPKKRSNMKQCLKKLKKLSKEDLGKNVFIYKIKYQDGEIIQLGTKGKNDKEN